MSTAMEDVKADWYKGRMRLRKAALWVVEGLAVLIVLLALALGVLTWRVASGPLDLDFAKDHLTEMLEDPQTGISVRIGEAALYWPDLTGPLFIGLKNFEISNREGRKLAEIGEAAIGLSRSRLLIGKLAPRTLILKKPGLKLIRREDNKIDFGFVSEQSDTAGRQDLLERLVSLIIHPGDEESEGNRFYRLNSLVIEDARVMVEDHVEGITWFQHGLNLSVEEEDGALKTLLAMNFEGIPLEVHGNFTAAENGIEGMLESHLPNLNHQQIAASWPESLKADASYEWIGQKIKTASYTNLSAQAWVSLMQTEGVWAFSLASALASFEFDTADVDYRAPLHPLENAKGKGQFDLMQDKLDITIESGAIGGIALSESTLGFTDIIAKGKGNVRVQSKTKGALKDYLAYAAREPISMAGNLGFDIDKVKGEAVVDVMLDFPTRKDALLDEFDISITGKITDAAIPGLVGKADLTGGTLALTSDETEAMIEGKALLGGQPITLKHEAYLRSRGKPHKSKTSATLQTNEDSRALLGLDLASYWSGPASIDLKQTEYPDGKTLADIKVNMKDSRLSIPELRYEKPAGANTTAAMEGVVLGGSLSELKKFTLEGPQLKIEPSTLKFGKRGEETRLIQATIPRFNAGETVGSLDMVQEGNRPETIVLKGPFLDARAFVEGDLKEEDPAPQTTPRIISVAVDRMRTGDEQTVEYAKIYADIGSDGAFNQFEIDARAGQGDVYLRFKPDGSGRRIFHFEADDAGAALKAFGVYNNMMGGTISIVAEPMDGPDDRNMQGTALIENFKLIQAPALARLLGALSVPGLMQLLGSDGLSFSKLEAGFEWLYDPAGGVLVVKDGRTSGNSLGLTFDGAFDQADNTMNIEGTIIPLSTLNKIVGSIPILGDLITGGTGSVFAATYTMKGDTKNPDVMVNPLSVLTPGILRRILFEN